jgi:hypothetical protein
MAKAKKSEFVVPDMAKKFQREESVIIDGFEVLRGDIIKVKGQHGSKFKFSFFTTNTETGSTWIDCFELQKGLPGAFRSFSVEDVKRVPKKRKRAKRVV